MAAGMTAVTYTLNRVVSSEGSEDGFNCPKWGQSQFLPCLRLAQPLKAKMLTTRDNNMIRLFMCLQRYIKFKHRNAIDIFCM